MKTKFPPPGAVIETAHAPYLVLDFPEHEGLVVNLFTGAIIHASKLGDWVEVKTNELDDIKNCKGC